MNKLMKIFLPINLVFVIFSVSIYFFAEGFEFYAFLPLATGFLLSLILIVPKEYKIIRFFVWLWLALLWIPLTIIVIWITFRIFILQN